VARARISAQDTVASQAASTLVLMSSITSKPLNEFMLGNAFFSPVNVALSSNKIDASQPCKQRNNQNYKENSFELCTCSQKARKLRKMQKINV